MPDKSDLELRTSYEQNFLTADRHGPDDPLEYHLYHLALYWSRLDGFARHHFPDPSIWSNTDLARCVRLGNYYVEKTIEPGSPVATPWFEYLIKADFVSCDRMTSLAEVEETVSMFNRCLEVVNFDPWKI